MSKKAKKTAPRARRAARQHTLETFVQLTLAEQIDVARPFARDLLENGIDHHSSVGEPWTFHLSRMVDDEAIDKLCDGELAVWSTRFEAALALGIALGLMLRPEAFQTDGVR